MLELTNRMLANSNMLKSTKYKEEAMSLINKAVSDFKTMAYQKGVGEKEVSLKDVKGKWAVFFFYPADFTFVCPTELEDLQANYEKFKEADCEIYSVSCDSHFVHKAWADASEAINGLEFTMLADPTGKIAKDFDVYIEEEGQAERGTFIINPEGEIVGYEVNAGNVGRSAKELLRKIHAFQFVHEHGDKVCPANWDIGDDTLEPSMDLVGKL